MKLSNFKLLKIIKTEHGVNEFWIAQVNVTRGILWWKTTKTEKIFRRSGGVWSFLENGCSLGKQGNDVTNLYDAYLAMTLAYGDS